MEHYLINPHQKISKINKNIYGHFSEHLGRCIYEGLFVGEDSDIPNVNGMRCDVVDALKEMGIPVLRWPGGCFADEYHWKDGIGPKEMRKKMINTHWGGVIEDNSFGTHEYFELCRQLGCDTYINGNLGSGTVQEMSEWVEYMTFDGVSPMAEMRKANGREKPWIVNYFGVGNENWGCGGNMAPECYASQFVRYNTYIRNFNREHPIYRVACGPNSEDYNWTDKLMERAHNKIDGISLHYYTDIWDSETRSKKSSTDFTTHQYYQILARAYKIDEIISHHIEIMNKHDMAHKVDLIVDEWGTWYDVEPGTNPGFLYQQNTMRDAMVAALTLNIFNKHSDRIRMANIAQAVNVLQAVALTDKEKMILTPTYYVFKMFKTHQENTLLGSYITSHSDIVDCKKSPSDNGMLPLPQLIESASEDENGRICATIVNTSASKGAKVKCQIADTTVKNISAEIITGGIHDMNEFDAEEKVSVSDFTSFKKRRDGFTADLPACSIVKFIIEK